MNIAVGALTTVLFFCSWFFMFENAFLKQEIESHSSIPASCYINTDQQLFCVDSEGRPIPIILYKSYEQATNWDSYGKRKENQ